MKTILTSKIFNSTHKLFLNHFLDPNDKRLDIATILFDKYKENFPQEIHNIFMWLWKDYSIKIKSFNDLLNLKSSTIEYYYKIIYIVYIQLLLHDLYLNKDAEIKPYLIKGTTIHITTTMQLNLFPILIMMF